MKSWWLAFRNLIHITLLLKSNSAIILVIYRETVIQTPNETILFNRLIETATVYFDRALRESVYE